MEGSTHLIFLDRTRNISGMAKKTITKEDIKFSTPSLRKETGVKINDLEALTTYGTPSLRNLDVSNSQADVNVKLSVSGRSSQVQTINTKLRNIDLRRPEPNTEVSRQLTESQPRQTVSKTNVKVQRSKLGTQVQSNRNETTTDYGGTPSLRKEVRASNWTENTQYMTSSSPGAILANIQTEIRNFKANLSPPNEASGTDKNKRQALRPLKPRISAQKLLPELSAVTTEKPDRSSASDTRPEDPSAEDLPEESGNPDMPSV